MSLALAVGDTFSGHQKNKSSAAVFPFMGLVLVLNLVADGMDNLSCSRDSLDQRGEEGEKTDEEVEELHLDAVTLRQRG